jgi:hypothetical protein
VIAAATQQAAKLTIRAGSASGPGKIALCSIRSSEQTQRRPPKQQDGHRFFSGVLDSYPGQHHHSRIE